MTLDYVRSAPAAGMLARLRSWVIQFDPVCLVHPHGFFVVLLHRSGTEEWRFHWWPKGPRPLTGMPAMIHTHNKVVESKILDGTLRNVLYKVTDVASGGQPVYEVGYLGDKYARSTANVLQRTAKRVRAEIGSCQFVEAGDCYSIDRHAYHEAIVPEDAVTATIVCMHLPSPGPVRVLGLDGFPERIEFQRTERSAAGCMGFA